MKPCSVFGGAEQRAAHRLVRIAQLVEVLEHDVVRRILRRADLLHDHAFLALEFFGTKVGLARMSDSTSSASGTSAFSTRA